jgi:nucleoside-diphosphate-sugar epimerase
MPIVAISGAAGFLGSHACEAFRDAGWLVRGLVRPGSRWTPPEGVQCVEATIDAASLIRAVARADLFVHGAAVLRATADAAAYQATNVEGTRAAVMAANVAGARFVLVSSQAAGGTGTAARPRLEEDPPGPVTPYGRSKLAAEEEVRAHARVPWTIVRPVSIYGPRDRQFLPLFRMGARGFFPLVGRHDTAFSLIHVHDAVRGLMLGCGPEAEGETFFLAHPAPVRGRDLLQAIAEALGRRFRPTPISGVALRMLAATGDAAWRLGWRPTFDSVRLTELCAEGFVCSTHRAADHIGFRAEIGLAEGVQDTARWYREQGWL